MKQWLQRFKNTGTIIALAGAIGLLLQKFGYNVDLMWVNETVTVFCTILVILGIANNPTTPSMDLPLSKKDTFDESNIKW